MGELRELAEWDWVMAPDGDVLHHLRDFDDPENAQNNWQGDGVASCGFRCWFIIPGLSSRMGAPRCRKCSKSLGWPDGKGSPKNDDTLRPLVEESLRRLETERLRKMKEAENG